MHCLHTGTFHKIPVFLRQFPSLLQSGSPWQWNARSFLDKSLFSHSQSSGRGHLIKLCAKFTMQWELFQSQNIVCHWCPLFENTIFLQLRWVLVFSDHSMFYMSEWYSSQCQWVPHFQSFHVRAKIFFIPFCVLLSHQFGRLPWLRIVLSASHILLASSLWTTISGIYFLCFFYW